MNEADLYFKLMPKKDTKEILKGIADDIKKDGRIERFYDFFLGLIIEDIEIFSECEPRLLTLSPQSIADILLK